MSKRETLATLLEGFAKEIRESSMYTDSILANVSVLNTAFKDENDKPIVAVVLVCDDDRDHNQQVLDAVNAIEDDDDLTPLWADDEDDDE